MGDSGGIDDDARVPASDVALRAPLCVRDLPSKTNGADGGAVTEDTAYGKFVCCRRRR